MDLWGIPINVKYEKSLLLININAASISVYLHFIDVKLTPERNIKRKEEQIKRMP